MMNWNKITVIVILLLSSIGMSAQDKNHRRERIKTLKIAYLTERLSLTSEEAQVFWPIYNQHEDKLRELRKKERKLMQSSDWDVTNAPSETDVKEYLKIQLQYRDEKHALHKSLVNKITEKLSAKKAVMLLKAEENFKKRLLQQYREKRN